MYDKTHYNIVKQLASTNKVNEKEKKKKKELKEVSG